MGAKGGKDRDRNDDGGLDLPGLLRMTSAVISCEIGKPSFGGRHAASSAARVAAGDCRGQGRRAGASEPLTEGTSDRDDRISQGEVMGAKTERGSSRGDEPAS